MAVVRCVRAARSHAHSQVPPLLVGQWVSAAKMVSAGFREDQRIARKFLIWEGLSVLQKKTVRHGETLVRFR